jgi:hypothetical protein
MRAQELAHQGCGGELSNKEGSFFTCEGAALALPGFNALRQNGGCGATLAARAIPALGRRSGRIPAEPYPPPR